jgi:hypothetical protein
VGSKVISNLDVSQLLSDEAREADDKAFWLATRDALGHMKVNTFGKPDLPTLLAMKLD